jgi:hypothetical protein
MYFNEAYLSPLPKWLHWHAMHQDTISDVSKTLAQNSLITSSDLTKALLLHLPRFTPNELIHDKQIWEEGCRLSQILKEKRAAFPITAEKSLQFERAKLFVAECRDDLAQQIYETFHYIGSCRKGIVHLGLFHASNPSIPVSVLTLSEMDVGHMKTWFSSPEEERKAVILSRAFSFDWAPRNSMSFLLSYARKWLHAAFPEVEQAFTYINPNLGFTGASYRAAGWEPFATKTTRYRYQSGHYLTYRCYETLSEQERATISQSQFDLSPLVVFKVALKAKQRRDHGSQELH